MRAFVKVQILKSDRRNQMPVRGYSRLSNRLLNEELNSLT